ncbi:MAG TPA: PaaI family thioesterase [Hydrogenophaga sp.]|uniref:PaaI family thioesterase n=1 Tax=Hydrogenophaga sp. TaxID=1904254 RepID=UPI002D0DA6D8|nr:PaaI family thioesterase [Hydrogenophaga sp.]HMN92687.1 PaaI family thioesterase [Hydrogenophaga sp.]HMP09270.1 PaaI family thioesterase [Hydrogenophaga sp.]
MNHHRSPDIVPMDADRLQQLLSDWFAPWVQELGLRVESFGDGEATVRLPFTERLARIGGMVCGQALMAAADTAMVLAIVSRLGDRQPMTTVQQSTSFLKPLAGQDALVTARIVRAGKSLVFGEIDIVAGSDGKSVCRASTTYALL